MRYLLLIGFCVSCSMAFAEPPEDKLDAILKELRSISQRVDALEARIANLETGEPSEILGQQKLQRLLPLQPAPQPQSIIRMQIEEPGSLLKNIHQREQELRKRPFPPDLF